MKFGLMFFTNEENTSRTDTYRLVMEAARFADQNDFSCLWLPERHFSSFGSLYPNPAVLHAAIAVQTEHIRLRSGSVVLPLHNPLRVAEEWAMVDNLSNGRAEIAFGSGWHPRDFAFYPENYATRSDDLYSGIELVRKLWRGESVKMPDGNGNSIDIRTYPSPIQKELPTWITAAGNPDTFIRAGEIGANILTHLFSQETDELETKINLYRQARAQHGFDPDTGTVAVMLHSFIGDDLETVREQVREPYCNYLKNNKETLLKGLALNRSMDIDIDRLSVSEFDDLIEFVFDRFFSNRALMGTPESCAPLITELGKIGVNEIACLLDFGPEDQLIIDNLPYLNVLRELCVDTPTLSSIGKAVSSNITPIKENPITHQSTLQELRERCQGSLNVDAFYEKLAAAGADWGSGFKAITHLWKGSNEALARIELPEEHGESHSAYGIHPILWDNCYELIGTLVLDDLIANSSKFILLQQGYRSVRTYANAEKQVWSHFTGIKTDTNDKDGLFEGDVRIYNAQGELIAEVLGWRCKLLIVEDIGKVAGPQSTQNAPNKLEDLKAGLQQFQGCPEDQKEIFIKRRVVMHIDKMLGLDPGQLALHHSLIDLGLDSILAIGLRNSLESDLCVAIPIVNFLLGMTAEQLQETVLNMLLEGDLQLSAELDLEEFTL